MAGADSISWVHLTAACELIKRKTPSWALPVIHYGDVLNMVGSFWPMRHRTNLSTLLPFTYYCEATDPRDHIYGLLGIASESSTSKIVVDYGKDVKEVFLDALGHSLADLRHLKLLSLCDSASKPTWIPDLHRTRGLRPLFRGMAGLASPAEMRIISKTHAEARGVECDAITEVLGPDGEEESSANDQLQSLVVEAARRFLGPNPDAWAQETFRHFCLAMYIHLPAGHPSVEFEKARLAYSVSPDSTAPARPGNSERQDLAFTYFLRGRSLYLTKNGYIMMGPRGCQPGDIVCVLLGSNLPTVLRPTDNEEYEIKGPASHPRLFFGEALLGELPEGWQVTYPEVIWSHVFEGPNGEQQNMDPRLSDIPIPDGWKFLRRKDDGQNPPHNEKRGYSTKFDPRTSAQELQKRGVQIRTFTLT